MTFSARAHSSLAHHLRTALSRIAPIFAMIATVFRTIAMILATIHPILLTISHVLTMVANIFAVVLAILTAILRIVHPVFEVLGNTRMRVEEMLAFLGAHRLKLLVELLTSYRLIGPLPAGLAKPIADVLAAVANIFDAVLHFFAAIAAVFHAIMLAGHLTRPATLRSRVNWPRPASLRTFSIQRRD